MTANGRKKKGPAGALVGMDEARRRIRECREEHPTWLDLGSLDLSELPDELFDLDDLQVLISAT